MLKLDLSGKTGLVTGAYILVSGGNVMPGI
jgi:hypothetical protein